MRRSCFFSQILMGLLACVGGDVAPPGRPQEPAQGSPARLAGQAPGSPFVGGGRPAFPFPRISGFARAGIFSSRTTGCSL